MIPNHEDLEPPDDDDDRFIICDMCDTLYHCTQDCPKCRDYDEGEDIKAQDEIEDRKDNGLLTKEG
jgi:hypothetical protein